MVMMRAVSSIFGVFTAILLALAMPRPLLADARVESNVVFGMYSGLALLMDVHHPAKPNGYGIIFISGSGWLQSMSLDAEPLKSEISRSFLGTNELLERGYTLFSINHRSAPRYRYPDAVHDAQRAVRYVRYHAADYKIDRERIGAFGDSSGGHLVSMLGVLDGEGKVRDASPINRESAKVQAVVAMHPATDFIAFARGGDGEKELVAAFMGIPLWSDPQSQEAQLYVEASPRSHVTNDDAPFLLIHGDEDSIVPFNQSQLLQTALLEAEVPVALIKMPGGGHGKSISAGPDAADFIGPILDWFDHHLRDIP